MTLKMLLGIEQMPAHRDPPDWAVRTHILTDEGDADGNIYVSPSSMKAIKESFGNLRRSASAIANDTGLSIGTIRRAIHLMSVDGAVIRYETEGFRGPVVEWELKEWAK